MASTVIPGAPVIRQLEGRLAEYLGAQAKFIDLSGFYFGLVENVFYGNVMSNYQSLVNYIQSYSDRIPVDQVEDMLEEAIDSIKKYVWSLVQVEVEDWSWDFDLTPRGDVVIHQLARSRPENPTDVLRRQIQEGVDKGDWYPEELRRQLGITGYLTDI